MDGDEDDEIRYPFYEKKTYRGIFHVPAPEWKIEAIWDDAYYQAAKRLITGVANGEYLPAYEGVVGLCLFRHYIELALKFAIFHSRWMKDAQTNALDKEIADVQKTHSLKQLWTIAKAECRRIIPDSEWKEDDIEFIDRCIDEFDAIDPNGERFRYPAPRFGVEKDPLKREEELRSLRPDLNVDFTELVDVIDRVRGVFHRIDTYMIETHAENE